jgi:hypothetical protein
MPYDVVTGITTLLHLVVEEIKEFKERDIVEYDQQKKDTKK